MQKRTCIIKIFEHEKKKNMATTKISEIMWKYGKLYEKRCYKLENATLSLSLSVVAYQWVLRRSDDVLHFWKNGLLELFFFCEICLALPARRKKFLTTQLGWSVIILICPSFSGFGWDKSSPNYPLLLQPTTLIRSTRSPGQGSRSYYARRGSWIRTSHNGTVKVMMVMTRLLLLLTTGPSGVQNLGHLATMMLIRKRLLFRGSFTKDVDDLREVSSG